MAVDVFHSWLMVALLSAVIVQTESSLQLRVNSNTCGTVTNIDKEEISLYLPAGHVDPLEDCRFDFTSSTFDHDTCFKMITPIADLSCLIKIEYRHFSSLIKKHLTCGDPTSEHEHCAIFSSMSVLFKTSHVIFNKHGVAIKAYRKYDEKDDDDSSSSLGVSVGIPIAICVLSLCICMAKKMCREAAGSEDSVPEEAQPVTLQDYSTQPSAPSFQPTNYPPSQAYGFGNQSHPHQPGGYALGYQPQNYPTGHQPSAPTPNVTADYQQPPPSYDEAKNYPLTKTAEDVDNDKSSVHPKSPQSMDPPPSYPWL